ncbi:MAG: hypothetical protein FWB79_02160 [Treponema sp.]|nr:hypothetical protein [Treponema sp.]
MIGFLLKKTFFDVWDNLLRIVLINLGFLVSVTIPVFLPGLVPVTLVSMLVFVLGILWCFVYLSAAAFSLKAVSDYGSFGFADFWANLKAGWKVGVAAGLIATMLFLMIWAIIPFYLAMESVLGFLLAAVIFWTFLLGLVSFQFFFAVRARLDTKLRKVIKKCFIIFFDNPGFAAYCLLHTIVTMVLSAFLALLLPGPAGAILFLDEALRLRLLKYDWLEENPPSTPKRPSIPWDAILIEEREKTGSRTLRNFIFPWKD